MAYELDVPFVAPDAGLIDLRAQLYDTSGANVGSAISTGFVDLGNQFYHWHYASFPDGHRGGVKFYSNAAPTVILAVAGINPQEAEYTDAKISTVSANVAAILDDTGTAGVAISSATMQALADAILSRGVSNVEGSADLGSLAELLLGMFESEANNATWVIYRTDHSTVFNTRSIAVSSAALPVIEVD